MTWDMTHDLRIPQVAGNRGQFLKFFLGVACVREYTYHTLFTFYFKDIQDLLPKFIRKITFENVKKMISEFPRLQKLGVNF